MATPETEPEAGDARRSSIKKRPIFVLDANTDADADADVDAGLDDKEPSAFERLPDEIIEQYAPSFSYYTTNLIMPLCG
jgi:hypothetical protein